jgi:hypothetical protein
MTDSPLREYIDASVATLNYDINSIVDTAILLKNDLKLTKEEVSEVSWAIVEYQNSALLFREKLMALQNAVGEAVEKHNKNDR